MGMKIYIIHEAQWLYWQMCMVCVPRATHALYSVQCSAEVTVTYQDNSFNHKNSHNFADTKDISILWSTPWNAAGLQKFQAPVGVKCVTAKMSLSPSNLWPRLGTGVS